MHQIRVQIKAARDLRDATRFNGKTNFYVKVYVGDKKEKSFVLMDSGSTINEPVDTVMVNISTEKLRQLLKSDAKVKISARNKCKVSFLRTIIGDTFVNIADFNCGLENWFPLKCKNKDAGNLLLNLSIYPPFEMGEMHQQPIVTDVSSTANSGQLVAQNLVPMCASAKQHQLQQGAVVQQYPQQQQQPMGMGMVGNPDQHAQAMAMHKQATAGMFGGGQQPMGMFGNHDQHAQAMAMHKQATAGMFGGGQQQQTSGLSGFASGFGGMMQAMLGGGSREDIQNSQTSTAQSMLGAMGMNLSNMAVVEYPEGPLAVDCHEHEVIQPRLIINFACSQCGMDRRRYEFLHGKTKVFHKYECVEKCGYMMCGQCMLEATGTAPPPGAPTITYNF
eukprot:TRINITY_DN765_c0_g1_i1.p1 TRINITY_DN765_c0_g1~~TRINITY_DN765_c0_g1_i1.p1  ORF type:complete len:390 (+),score=105.44 TRINITY_DN765_c0_g1_i1:67-1236(+)